MVKFYWSREITLHLIELYQKSPILYSPRHVHYKNRKKRDEALEIIRRNLYKDNLVQDQHLTIYDIKMKIHGLRTQYFKEMKRIQEGQAFGTIYIPTLWSFEQLSFLKESMKPNETVFDDTIQYNEIDSEESRPNNNKIFRENCLEDPTKNEIVFSSDSPEEVPEQSYVETLHQSSNVKRLEECPNSSTQSDTKEEHPNSIQLINVASKVLNDCFKKRKANEDDDISTFARLVEVEMRKIENKGVLRKVKKDIFNILMEAQNKDDDYY